MNLLRIRSLAHFRMALAVLALSSAALADPLPDVLPYGQDDIPMSPSERVNQTSQRLMDLLGGRVKDPYVPNRVQTQSELGGCQLPFASKYIREGMADGDPQVRTASAQAAGQNGDKALIDDLKKLMQDKDARVRRQVVLSGAALGDSSVINIGLTDEDATVIAAAASVAGAEQSAKLAGALAGYPVGTQIAALKSLGRAGDARNADAAAALVGASVPVRAAAATALGQMKATARAGDVIKLLADDHPTIRRAALAAVAGVSGVAEGQKRSIAALADPETAVREDAAKLLKQTPTPDAIDALVSNLPAESSRLHKAALDALVAVGPPVIPTAEKMLADSSPRRREDALFILAALKSDAGFTTQVALLKDTDWRVVRQAAIALGRLGRKEASPALAEVAQKANDFSVAPGSADYKNAVDAVEQSIVACTMLGEASILPMCKKIAPVKTNPTLFRSAAVYAVGRMNEPGDKSVTSLLTRPMGDLEESSMVQFECIKALGHLKNPAALSYVGHDRESAKWMGDAHADWLSYWVRSRLSGKVEPLTPIQLTWTANSSIVPLSE